MQGLFNKIEFKGELSYVGELKRTAKGKQFINGIIKSYAESGEGKKSYYLSMPFIAFDKNAETIGNLQKEDIVLLHGSLQENNYKDNKQIQILVASAVPQETSNYAPKPYNESKFEQKETPKKNITPDFFDDLPF